MEVTIAAIKEVLDGVEGNLEKALHDTVVDVDTYRLDNKPHVRSALENVQEAIIELLLVR